MWAALCSQGSQAFCLPNRPPASTSCSCFTNETGGRKEHRAVGQDTSLWVTDPVTLSKSLARRELSLSSLPLGTPSQLTVTRAQPPLEVGFQTPSSGWPDLPPEPEGAGRSGHEPASRPRRGDPGGRRPTRVGLNYGAGEGRSVPREDVRFRQSPLAARPLVAGSSRCLERRRRPAFRVGGGKGHE